MLLTPWSTPRHLFKLSIQNERCQRTPNAADLANMGNVRGRVAVLKCGCDVFFCKPDFRGLKNYECLTFLETICSDLLREEVSLQLCHIFGDESKLKLGTARYRVMVLFLGTVFFG